MVSRKVSGSCTLKCDNSITDKCQDLISTNSLKTKADKSKNNKSLAFENELNENTKRSKCQARNTKTNKEVVCNMQNKQNIMVSEKSDNAKEKESVSLNGKSKKYNAKEAKEKKNKEDTRNKNRGSRGNNIDGNKETLMPFARNKDQLPEQVHVPIQICRFSFSIYRYDYIYEILCVVCSFYLNIIFSHFSYKGIIRSCLSSILTGFRYVIEQ